MGHAVVQSMCLELFFGHFVSVLDAGVGIAESKVAGGVFVKQSVVEQDAAVGNRRIIRNKSNFTESGCALIQSYSLFKELLPTSA